MKKIYSILFSENYPRIYIIILDQIIIFLCLILAKIIFKNEVFNFDISEILLPSLCFIVFGKLFGIYNSYNRYFNFIDFIFLALTTLGSAFSFFIYNNFNFDKSVIYFLFILIILSFYRGVLKFVFTESIKSAGKNRTIIFGAGKIGAMIKRSFSSSSSFNIIGFIDDDKSKHGNI